MKKEETQIQNLHFLDYWRVVRLRWPMVTLVFLLVMLTAVAATYLMPKKYTAIAVMEVEQDAPLMAIFPENGGVSSLYDPRFATTQYQIIQRKEMLYPVIETLALEQRWGKAAAVKTKEQAYQKLRGMIDVREVRNTNLLQVGVTSEDPAEAAELANAISEGYQKKRVAEQRKTVSRSLETLEAEVGRQREMVARTVAEMSRLRGEIGINDLAPDSEEDPSEALDKVLIEQESKLAEMENLVSARRSRYEELSKLSGDDLMRALPTMGIEDQTVSQILPEYQEAEAELARVMKSGLGPRHPKIMSLSAKKETYLRQLSDQMESLRRTLEADLRIAEKSAETTRNEVEKMRMSQRTARERSSEYARAKNDHIQAKKVLESAELRLATESMQRSMPMNPARIWERAEPPQHHSSPRPRVNILLGLAAAAVLAVGLAFLLEYLDTSVKTMEEVESFLGVPVLGVVPQGVSVLPKSPPHPQHEEPYRLLGTNIEFNRKNESQNTVVFVSGAPGEGKSTTLANLAWILSSSGRRTLVVDADLRRPTQNQIFNVPVSPGLSEALMEKGQAEPRVHRVGKGGLFVIPSGSPPRDPSALLGSRRMKDLIDQFSREYEMVLVDAPPILGVADTSVLSRLCELTVVVVQHRRFPRAMLRRVAQAVASSGGTMLGVVMNNVDVRGDQNYEYYTGYSGYYKDTPPSVSRPSPPPEY